MRHADAVIRTAGRGFGSSSALCYPSVAGDQKWADASPPLSSDQPPSVRATRCPARTIIRVSFSSTPPPVDCTCCFRHRFPPREIADARTALCIIDTNVCLQLDGLHAFRVTQIVTNRFEFIVIDVLLLYSSVSCTRNDHFIVFVIQTFIHNYLL